MRVMEYAMQYGRIAERFWRKEAGKFKEVAAS
jgi:hypothetical protein